MALDIRSDLKELSSVERELSIIIPGDQVAKELDRAYRQLSQKVKLKGFRKGKVPRYVLEQYYKDQTEADVLERIVGQSYQIAVEEHSITPVAPPEVQAPREIIPGMDFSYQAKVEIKPVIELQKTDGLEAKKITYTVDDDDVLAQLERMREAMVKVVPVEDRDTAQQGDLVEVNWSGTVEGEPVKGLRGMSYVVEIGAGRFFVEAEQALVGKKLGESFDVDVDVPEDHRLEAAAGKTAKLTISPVELKTKEMPELDDDFAQDVHDDFDNLEDLKKSLKEDMTKAAEARTKSQAKESVLDAFIEANPFDVPNALVERQAEEMAASQLQQLPREQAEAIWMSQRTAMIEGMRPQALRTVRAGLLLEVLVDKNEVKIDDEAVEEHLKKLAEQAGQNFKTLKNLYRKGRRREELEQHLAAEKALDQLCESASYSEETKALRGDLDG
jgi:trigger factor